MENNDERVDGTEHTLAPWERPSALIKATVNEIRVLARAYRVTADECCLQAASAGTDFILEAQHPSGGWPRSHPHFRTPYDRYVTFKDQEMTEVMRFLRQVMTERDFEVFDTKTRTRAQQAFEKGIGYILASQVVVRGRPTIWSQQHDEVTFEPRAARDFKPIALSALDSADVLTLLMSIEHPSRAIIRAVDDGIAWYDGAKLEGLRIERTSHDCVVRIDSAAPPIWSRFYQLGTDRPIFAGHNGVTRYHLADIEKERRAGYAWYGHWGKDVMEQYALWRRAMK
jgi:PelA/Pel-15E family pectate lyase